MRDINLKVHNKYKTTHNMQWLLPFFVILMVKQVFCFLSSCQGSIFPSKHYCLSCVNMLGLFLTTTKVTKTDTKTTNQIYFSDSAHEYFVVPLTFANKEWSFLTRSWNCLHEISLKLYTTVKMLETDPSNRLSLSLHHCGCFKAKCVQHLHYGP